jgi:hypothetical protein
MYDRMLRSRVVKQCLTKPVLRSTVVAVHLASLPRPDRRAKRLFLILYYAVCAQCLAAACVVNLCLLTGRGGHLKYYALFALILSMGLSIVCSTRYERRHRAVFRDMRRESKLSNLE